MDMSNDGVSDFSANSEMGQTRLNKLMMTNRELSVISDYEQIQANPALSAFQANMPEGNDRKMSMRDFQDLSKAVGSMNKSLKKPNKPPISRNSKDVSHSDSVSDFSSVAKSKGTT